MLCPIGGHPSFVWGNYSPSKMGSWMVTDINLVTDMKSKYLGLKAGALSYQVWYSYYHWSMTNLLGIVQCWVFNTVSPFKKITSNLMSDRLYSILPLWRGVWWVGKFCFSCYWYIFQLWDLLSFHSASFLWVHHIAWFIIIILHNTTSNQETYFMAKEVQ